MYVVLTSYETNTDEHVLCCIKENVDKPFRQFIPINHVHDKYRDVTVSYEAVRYSEQEALTIYHALSSMALLNGSPKYSIQLRDEI